MWLTLEKPRNCSSHFEPPAMKPFQPRSWKQPSMELYRQGEADAYMARNLSKKLIYKLNQETAVFTVTPRAAGP
jgi:hypothetical protein